MAQTYFPFDSGAGANVTESQWSKMARNWLETGVIKSYNNDMQVYADSTGMQTKIKTGAAWIKGHYFESDAEEVLAIGVADGTNPRIDRVVIRLDWSLNTIKLAVLQGTPAASPVAPTLTQNTARWEISLAKVQVNANVSTITAGNITDERIFTGIQSLNQTDTTQDFLANIAALGNGMHLFYAASGSLNGPPSGKSIRGIAFTTGVGFTFIWCTDYTNTLFTNYCNGGTWTGWQQLAASASSTPYTNLTLQNGWTNVSGYATAGYLLDEMGFVHLRGSIANGATTSGTIIATLPVGCRPINTIFVEVTTYYNSSSISSTLQINPNGTITCYGNVGNTNLSLDMFPIFKAEQ